MSWATSTFGPMNPAEDNQPSYPDSTKDRKDELRSKTAGKALNGAFVRAPSEPAPVVEGLLPVIEEMNSMNNSGSSM